MKIPKATVTAVLYKSKTLASGEHPVMIRVCYNSKRRYKSTGLSCPAKWWNAAKQEVRERHPLAPNMNAIIGSELTALKNKVLDFERQGVPYSVQRIFEASVRPPPAPENPVRPFRRAYRLFQGHPPETQHGRRLPDAAPYRRTVLAAPDRRAVRRGRRMARRVRGVPPCEYADTSIKRFFSALKALMNYACQNGLLDANPFDRFRLSRRLDVRTAKRALATVELDSLICYYLDTYYYKTRKRPDPRTMKRRCWRAPCRGCRGEERQTSYDAEQFALSMFICSYIFQRLALVDLARLRWKDLVCVEIPDRAKYDRDCAAYGPRYAEAHKETVAFYEINFVRAKTLHPIRILVEQRVAWPYMKPFARTAKGGAGDDFVFPIYFDDDAQRRFERITYANNVINQGVQRAAKRIGLSRKLTFYSARHTYASRLYHADVPLPLIAQNMGRNPAEIETYLKEFDTDRIISANKRVWQIPGHASKDPKTGAGL